MKSTLAMNYRMLSSNLERSSNRLYDLRQQAATGKQMNRPSDNPSGIRPVLDYRVKTQAAERSLNQMSMAQGEMEVLDSSLDQVENILVAAKETGIAAISGAANEADRQTYADKIGQLREELLQAANTQNGGKYMYAGYSESTVPFRTVDDGTEDWDVEYDGDGHAKTVDIGTGNQVQVALPGNELFLGDYDNDGITDADGENLFAALKDFEAAIRNNDKAAMNNGLETLEESADQVRRLRGRMGNNAWRIERASEQLNGAAIEFEKILSSYEDADALEVFSQLVQQETAFEAALNVTTRISKLSILDFMR